MKRKRAVSALFALASVLALLAPSGAAAAKPGFFTVAASRLAVVHFAGTNGFSFDLEMSGGRNPRTSYFSLSARTGSTSAIYSTRKRVRLGPDGSISAHLPGVGGIHLDFQPISSHRAPSLDGCRGGPSIESHGYFRGRIDLRGRQGFSVAHLHSARGSLTEDSRRTCPRHGPRRGPQARRAAANPPLLALTAARRTGNVSVSYVADAIEFGDEPDLDPTSIAFAVTIAHGVTFAAIVFDRGGKKVLDVPDLKSLVSAKVEPTAPFTGSAEYDLLRPKKSSWSGDLAVELPGFGPVTLAGPKFRSSLCLNRRCTGSLPPPSGNFDISIVEIGSR